MSTENLIAMAALWDGESVTQAALEWLESPEGALLLKLKPSQFNNLVRSPSGSRSPEEFLEDLRLFLERQKSHEKRRSVWARLLDSLPAAIEAAVIAAAQSRHKRNDAFSTCCLLLKRAGRTKNVETLIEERRVAVMRVFLGALAQRYRARRLQGVIV